MSLVLVRWFLHPQELSSLFSLNSSFKKIHCYHRRCFFFLNEVDDSCCHDLSVILESALSAAFAFTVEGLVWNLLAAFQIVCTETALSDVTRDSKMSQILLAGQRDNTLALSVFTSGSEHRAGYAFSIGDIKRVNDASSCFRMKNR